MNGGDRVEEVLVRVFLHMHTYRNHHRVQHANCPESKHVQQREQRRIDIHDAGLMAAVVGTFRVSFLISSRRTMLPAMQGSNGRYRAAILAARKPPTLVRFIDSRSV